MFTCCSTGKPEHTHDDPMEVLACYGFIKPYVAPIATPTWHDRRDEPGSMTPKQESYLKFLGASDLDLLLDGYRLSVNQASSLIDYLKKGGKKSVTTEPAEDPRITMLRGLIGTVPPGYYAVRPDDTVNYTFVRISEPKTGRFIGTVKFQTQHGDEYRTELIIWPSGRWRVYRESFLDDLLLLVVDHHSAAITYGRIIGKCCRCGKALTDDRSRHYGIGPECEGHWPFVIEEVDSEVGSHYAR